jgi:hypothetical protein
LLSTTILPQQAEITQFIFGQPLTLGQQGVGADVLVFDVNGVEQRNSGSDFVGLLDGFGITVYRQGANFFWV